MKLSSFGRKTSFRKSKQVSPSWRGRSVLAIPACRMISTHHNAGPSSAPLSSPVRRHGTFKPFSSFFPCKAKPNLPSARRQLRTQFHAVQCRSFCSQQQKLAPAFRNLGSSGIKVSELSFGSWLTFGEKNNFTKEQENLELVRTAYDNGINFFDTAEVYGAGESELILGRVLKKLGFKRETLVISSKLFWGGKTPNELGLSRKHLMEGTTNSLKRLDMDYLDLLFCHRPDPSVPMAEIVRTMNTLIAQGKILYWGTSEWSREELENAYKVADQLGLEGPTMEQPEYNMLHREKFEGSLLPVFKKGLGTTIWSPLKFGILTGKYNQGINVPNSRIQYNNRLKYLLESEEGRKMIETTRKLDDFCTKKFDGKVTLGNLAIAWCLNNPNVSSVILGASKVSQLEENMKSLEAFKYLQEDSGIMKEIDTILTASNF